MAQPIQSTKPGWASHEGIVRMTSPVDESNRSMPLRAVIGCPYNKCRFCIFYHETKDGPKDFAVRPLAEVKQDVLGTRDFYSHSRFQHRQGKIESIFIGDGDVLAMPAPQFLELLSFMRENVPGLQRVTGYARAKGILAGKDDLAALREGGLTDLYVGFESGSGLLLKLNNKDATVLDNLRVAEHLNRSGIGINAMVISGIGGAAYSEQHAQATATMLGSMNADTLVITRFMLSPAYEQMVKEGTFKPASDEQIVFEELTMAERVHADRRFFISTGVACCGEHFKADSKQQFIEELQRTLAFIREGGHLDMIYRCGGGW